MKASATNTRTIAPFAVVPLAAIPVDCAAVDEVVELELVVFVIVDLPTLCPTIEKLAQLMRVVFTKWITKERFPKKEPRPGRVEANSSIYVSWKGSEAMLPCLPDRSPTWQVCGKAPSQAGISPRINLIFC